MRKLFFEKMRLIVVISFIGFIVFAQLALAGCGSQPLKKPDTASPAPQKQNTKANSAVEPEITVFMHETDEIETMKFEEYIAAVVAGEMKNDWPVEALAAQAIIARTFTLEAMERKGGVPARGTDASTDIREFQAFNAKEVNDNVKKAVDMTRGQVMTYEGGAAKTWFHASAGGKTATAKEGLNYRQAEPAYIQSVESPDDLAPQDVKSWQAVFEKEEVLEALKKQGVAVDSLNSMETAEKGPSGRTVSLLVNGSEKVSGPDFRVSLSSVKLKSMLLDKIEVSDDKVTFKGYGYGHGVGMSQWGAHYLAKNGKNPEEIISHYFKDITIEKRWE